MEKFKNSLIINLILIFILNFIWCREFEECEGITDPDTIVASKRSCAKYIFCNGDNSYEGECLAGNYFNQDEETCDDAENVDCNIEEDENVKSIYEEESENSDIDGDGESEDGEQINETTIDNEDIDELFDNEIQEIDNEVQESNIVTLSKIPKCSKLYDFQNIRHIANPESCVAFYTCYHGIAIPMLCPNKMYFNEETGKCETQIPKKCKLKNSITLNCHKGVNDYMPHPQKCEYYNYCLNGFLLIMRCPYDFTWHYERRTCVHKTQSKCYFEHSVIYRYPS